MPDSDVTDRLGSEIYVGNKGRDILARAKRMGQTRSNFIGAVLEKYGEAYIADLKKLGLKEAPEKKAVAIDKPQ